MADAAPFRRRRDKARHAHDHSSSDTARRATLRRERALEPIDECARESEARRRRGRGRVANVHETSRDIEGEVVDEPSVGVERLGPNAGWSGKEVARAKGGHVAARRGTIVGYGPAPALRASTSEWSPAHAIADPATTGPVAVSIRTSCSPIARPTTAASSRTSTPREAISRAIAWATCV